MPGICRDFVKIIEILFPVFSLVLVGYVYGRLHRPGLQAVNQTMMLVFVPALAFDVMSNKAFHIVEYQWLAVSGLIVVLGPGLLAWPMARIFGYPPRAFVPTMMFNNCGNLGLPLAVLAFGDAGLEGAIVLFLVSNTLHFTLGAWLFGGIVSWRGLLINPVILATIAGLMVNFMRIEVPGFVQQPISMMGQIVIPLMLFSLGTRMITVNRAHLRQGVLGGLLRPLIGLTCAGVAIWFIPLEQTQLGLLIIFAALPPAVLNFLFAEQYQQDPELVASLVLVGNAISVVVMAVVLLFVV